MDAGCSTKKNLSITLVLSLFLTQSLLAYAPETNFWINRKKQLPLTSAQRHPSPRLSSVSSLNSAPTLKHVLEALGHSYGNVRNIHQSKKELDAPIIIHIQDIHMNTEAQANIGKAVQSLINQGVVDLVALEGSFSKIDLKKIRAFQYPETIKKVSNYLLAHHKISGPIYSALTSQRPIPPFVGVDDETFYKANVEAHKKSAPLMAGLKKELAQTQTEIKNKKERIFNAELKKLDAKAVAFQKKELTLGLYIQALSQYISLSHMANRFLAALKLEEENDLNQAAIERKALLARLLNKLSSIEATQFANQSVKYRTGKISHERFYKELQLLCGKKDIQLNAYPSFHRYVRYVLLSESLKSAELLTELSMLEKKAYDLLAKTETEKKLVKESRLNYLQSKLIDFSLTPFEWREYKNHVGKNNSFEDFYIQAEKRDASIAQNLISSIQENKADVVVLVTGGFHSNGIQEKLQDFNTITYVPKISKIETATGNAYLSVFSQTKAPLEELFEGQKLFLAQSPHQIYDLPFMAAGYHLSEAEAILNRLGLAEWKVMRVDEKPGASQILSQNRLSGYFHHSTSRYDQNNNLSHYERTLMSRPPIDPPANFFYNISVILLRLFGFRGVEHREGLKLISLPLLYFEMVSILLLMHVLSPDSYFGRAIVVGLIMGVDYFIGRLALPVKGLPMFSHRVPVLLRFLIAMLYLRVYHNLIETEFSLGLFILYGMNLIFIDAIILFLRNFSRLITPYPYIENDAGSPAFSFDGAVRRMRRVVLTHHEYFKKGDERALLKKEPLTPEEKELYQKEERNELGEDEEERLKVLKQEKMTEEEMQSYEIAKQRLDEIFVVMESIYPKDKVQEVRENLSIIGILSDRFLLTGEFFSPHYRWGLLRSSRNKPEIYMTIKRLNRLTSNAAKRWAAFSIMTAWQKYQMTVLLTSHEENNSIPKVAAELKKFEREKAKEEKSYTNMHLLFKYIRYYFSDRKAVNRNQKKLKEDFKRFKKNVEPLRKKIIRILENPDYVNPVTRTVNRYATTGELYQDRFDIGPFQEQMTEFIFRAKELDRYDLAHEILLWGQFMFVADGGNLPPLRYLDILQALVRTGQYDDLIGELETLKKGEVHIHVQTQISFSFKRLIPALGYLFKRQFSHALLYFLYGDYDPIIMKLEQEEIVHILGAVRAKDLENWLDTTLARQAYLSSEKDDMETVLQVREEVLSLFRDTLVYLDERLNKEEALDVMKGWGPFSGERGIDQLKLGQETAQFLKNYTQETDLDKKIKIGALVHQIEGVVVSEEHHYLDGQNKSTLVKFLEMGKPIFVTSRRNYFRNHVTEEGGVSIDTAKTSVERLFYEPIRDRVRIMEEQKETPGLAAQLIKNLIFFSLDGASKVIYSAVDFPNLVSLEVMSDDDKKTMARALVMGAYAFYKKKTIRETRNLNFFRTISERGTDGLNYIEDLESMLKAETGLRDVAFLANYDRVYLKLPKGADIFTVTSLAEEWMVEIEEKDVSKEFIPFSISRDKAAGFYLHTDIRAIEQTLDEIKPEGLVIGIGASSKDRFLSLKPKKNDSYVFIPYFLGNEENKRKIETPAILVKDKEGRSGVYNNGFSSILKLLGKAEAEGLTYRQFIERYTPDTQNKFSIEEKHSVPTGTGTWALVWFFVWAQLWKLFGKKTPEIRGFWRILAFVTSIGAFEGLVSLSLWFVFKDVIIASQVWVWMNLILHFFGLLAIDPETGKIKSKGILSLRGPPDWLWFFPIFILANVISISTGLAGIQLISQSQALSALWQASFYHAVFNAFLFLLTLLLFKIPIVRDHRLRRKFMSHLIQMRESDRSLSQAAYLKAKEMIETKPQIFRGEQLSLVGLLARHLQKEYTGPDQSKRYVQVADLFARLEKIPSVVNTLDVVDLYHMRSLLEVPNEGLRRSFIELINEEKTHSYLAGWFIEPLLNYLFDHKSQKEEKEMGHIREALWSVLDRSYEGNLPHVLGVIHQSLLNRYQESRDGPEREMAKGIMLDFIKAADPELLDPFRKLIENPSSKEALEKINKALLDRFHPLEDKGLYQFSHDVESPDQLVLNFDPSYRKTFRILLRFLPPLLFVVVPYSVLTILFYFGHPKAPVLVSFGIMVFVSTLLFMLRTDSQFSGKQKSFTWSHFKGDVQFLLPFLVFEFLSFLVISVLPPAAHLIMLRGTLNTMMFITLSLSVLGVVYRFLNSKKSLHKELLNRFPERPDVRSFRIHPSLGLVLLIVLPLVAWGVNALFLHNFAGVSYFHFVGIERQIFAKLGFNSQLFSFLLRQLSWVLLIVFFKRLRSFTGIVFISAGSVANAVDFFAWTGSLLPIRTFFGVANLADVFFIIGLGLMVYEVIRFKKLRQMYEREDLFSRTAYSTWLFRLLMESLSQLRKSFMTLKKRIVLVIPAALVVLVMFIYPYFVSERNYKVIPETGHVVRVDSSLSVEEITADEERHADYLEYALSMRIGNRGRVSELNQNLMMLLKDPKKSDKALKTVLERIKKKIGTRNRFYQWVLRMKKRNEIRLRAHVLNKNIPLQVFNLKQLKKDWVAHTNNKEFQAQKLNQVLDGTSIDLNLKSTKPSLYRRRLRGA